MPIASYKDMVIDAADAQREGRFWAETLSLRAEDLDDGDVVLRGDSGAAVVWVNTVPEPKSVKNRVHIDVNTTDIDLLVAAGASVRDAESFRWIGMSDPDGQEFCGFVREAPLATPFYELIWDCPDSAQASHEIATWWAVVLGAQVVDDEGYSYIEAIPESPWASFDFAPVPEPKTVKNRVHIDVWTDDVHALEEHGARVLRRPDEQVRWTVLADPHGNEFCAFLRTD